MRNLEILYDAQESACQHKNKILPKSQNHRMVGIGRTSGDHWVQPPCQSRVT